MEIATSCYYGLVKSPERLEAILRILPETERAECQRLLDAVQNMPPEQVRNRWQLERIRERLRLIAAGNARAGGRLQALPECLRALLLRRTRHRQEP